jgi:hypothetical protein
MEDSWKFGIVATILTILVRNYKSTIFYLKFTYFYFVMTTIVTVFVPYYMLKPRNVSNFV